MDVKLLDKFLKTFFYGNRNEPDRTYTIRVNTQTPT